MPAFHLPRPASFAFKAWVWLLLCAVLVQGGAGAVVQVLGRAHSHQTVQTSVHSEPAPALLDAFLAWREARLQALQTTSVFRHQTVVAGAHHHDGLERHHHGTGDVTVQSLDGPSTDATADTGSSAGGNAVQACGPTADFRAAPAGTAGSAWPGSVELRWSSALTTLPERPPKA